MHPLFIMEAQIFVRFAQWLAVFKVFVICHSATMSNFNLFFSTFKKFLVPRSNLVWAGKIYKSLVKKNHNCRRSSVLKIIFSEKKKRRCIEWHQNELECNKVKGTHISFTSTLDSKFQLSLLHDQLLSILKQVHRIAPNSFTTTRSKVPYVNVLLVSPCRP